MFKYRKKFFALFLIFFSCYIFAQNLETDTSFFNRMQSLQENLKTGNHKDFFNGIEYINFVEGQCVDCDSFSKKNYVQEAEKWLLNIFSNMKFSDNGLDLSNNCYESILKEDNELIKSCLSINFDREVIFISISGESFNLFDKNDEVYEFGRVFVFKYDSENDILMLIGYGVAG